MGFGLMFNIFPILFLFVFGLILALVISQFVRGAKQDRINRNAPRLTVQATVVAKRMQVGSNHHHNTNDMTHNYTYSKYFVTFEVASGDRMELPVPHNQYGLLVEGDHGKLTFQGTRYLQFERM